MNTRFLKEEGREEEGETGTGERMVAVAAAAAFVLSEERERELLIAAGERAGEHGAFFKS